MQEMQEMWVQSLGWEDPLEEEMAIHSSILAWGISRTEEPGGLQSVGSQRVRHKEGKHGQVQDGHLPVWDFLDKFSHLREVCGLDLGQVSNLS